MELKLYDTLTREKRVFAPIDPARVRMYVCGPTVYDFAHIGNARPVIVFDVLFRLLRHLYGAEHVTYVRNITDVDDKINARAAERGISIRELTEETYQNFKEDVAALGCLPPTVEPRATEHIEEMKALIERLVASGNAYVAEEHVLFSVPSMPDYGKLSKRPLDEMIAGARVDVAPYKRDADGFRAVEAVEARRAGLAVAGGIATPGRPGWHIECSAMSWKHLGETFDIHGGGIDLVFPHHENEIAQSRCAFHRRRDGEFLDAQRLPAGRRREDVEVASATSSPSARCWRTGRATWCGSRCCQAHYRQPINWTVKGLEEAEKALASFFDAASADAEPRPAPGVLEALARRPQHAEGDRRDARLEECRRPQGAGRHAGVLRLPPGRVARRGRRSMRRRRRCPPRRSKRRIAARNAARKAKNFTESDRIRDELAALGVVLKDSKDGTTWEVAR